MNKKWPAQTELNRQKSVAEDLQFHMSRCDMCTFRGLSLTTGNFSSSEASCVLVLYIWWHVLSDSCFSALISRFTGVNVHVTRSASLLSYLCKDQEAGGSRLCSTATPMSARMARSSLWGKEGKTFRLFLKLLTDCMIWTGSLVRRRMSAQQHLGWSGC